MGHIAQAQTLGNSPYASYGIGDQKYDNSLETKSMGGISTAYISDFNHHFNFQNPAANQNLEITSLKIQGTNENQYQKADNMKSDKHSTYLSGISLAFPISKSIKLGIGYQPFSSKDYRIITDNETNGVTKRHSLTGDGSINLVKLAVGYSITPKFSLGLSSNLYFGKLYDNETISYTNSSLINHNENQISVNHFNFTLGSVYQQKLKNNKKLTFGATYTFGNTSDFEREFNESTYFLLNGVKQYQSQSTQGKQKIKNTIPQEFSFGVGYGHDSKWFVSTQIDYKKAVNSSAFTQNFTYQNAYKFSVGGWYLPNYNNFRNYFSRVTYRYGAFYEKGNLEINGKDIDKYGIGLGVSLPFQKSNINRMSSIDLGLELGQRGTTKNNLVRENFLNFTIGINFANKWFEKQYYD